jgi:hypothetical protein
MRDRAQRRRDDLTPEQSKVHRKEMREYRKKLRGRAKP